jgi:4-amino-4-deoxy-L-arabinose transferase-like glycosyltransferase
MKKDKIFFWIITILTVGFVFAITLSGIINLPIANLDELWNFNTAKQIGSGLIPYRDISMITTPLTPWLSAFCLNIIGVNIFNFRILTAIMVSIIALVTMLVCKELTGKKFFGFVTTMILASILLINYRMDYNVTTIILVLIMLLSELKLIKKYKGETDSKIPLWVNHLLIGVIAGLAIINKQTLGLFICLAVVIIPLIFIKKDNKKEIFKNILYRVLGMLIPVAIFVIYLLISGTFQDFIDYAVLGIKSFDNFRAYSNLVEKTEGGINVLAILVPVITVLTLLVILIGRRGRRKGKKSALEQDEFTKLQLLFVYSLPMFSLVYPIADKIHFLTGIYIVSILMIYELYISISIIVKNKKARTKYLTYIFVFVGLMVYPLYSNIVYMKDNYTEYAETKKSDIQYYENTVYSSAIEKRVNELKEFIEAETKKGNKVFIVDAEAAASEIPLDIYNKNYSMFLKGNIGKEGEERIIKEIQKSDKCVYLIKQTKYSPNWQNPSKVTNYIRNNLYLVDSVYTYDCYVTKAGGY